MNLVTPPITFPACLARERAEGHPERLDHRRAVERAFEYESFQMLARETAPREHEMAIGRAHPLEYVEALRAAARLRRRRPGHVDIASCVDDAYAVCRQPTT